MYLPLEFVKSMSIDSISDQHSIKKCLKELIGQEKEALLFLKHNDEFLNPSYHGKFQNLNVWLLDNRRDMYQNMFAHPEKIRNGTEQDICAASDCITPFLIASLWSKNKQVYKFDSELEESLSDMDEVRLPVRVLDRLPYNEIYIDFSEDGPFIENFAGAFVNIIPYKNGYCICIMRINQKLMSMTGFIPFVPKENDDYADFVVNKDTYIVSDDKSATHVDYRKFTIFLLNALLYLCSENAEIKQSEVTKKTYRPSSVVKNKFSEIQINECGYIYGSVVRKQREKSPKDSEPSEKQSIRSRNSHPMRTHVRKAHWHHYWAGKGRQELVLRWIAPTVVGQGEKIATIHKVLE